MIQKTKTIAGILFLLSALFTTSLSAQVRYTGSTLSDPMRHDGGLSPVIGVHCIQTMRANRENPDSAHNVLSWTYNHQPMLTQWQGRLWMHYLSDPASEHVYPSQTFLQTSVDGHVWSAPRTIFPIYPLMKEAVMHQRCGWYISSKQTGEKLIAIGYYGICLNPKDDPNDGKGIGRVVREVKPDGSFGNIYFLCLNKDCKIPERQLPWPLYTKAKDKKFRKACEDILADPLMWLQMVEECDRNDEHLPLKQLYKAFNSYTLPDGRIAALWKHALSSISSDGGKTWSQPIRRSPGFVNSNAKIWGQRLSDGMYATVYNPSEYRWPLAISLSRDGEEYTTLNLIHGEITPLRYGGQYKSKGPQYVRGIEAVADRDKATGGNEPAWVAYSVNKEDMWVAKIPVPVRTEAMQHADDDFADAKTFDKWNIMSLVYAPVSVAELPGKGKALRMADKDHFDFAKAERVIPATRKLTAEFEVTPMQNNHGLLQIELLDKQGNACTRLSFQPDGQLTVKVGARYNGVLPEYKAGQTYSIRLLCDLDNRNITIWTKLAEEPESAWKKSGPKMLFAPLDAITRIAFRTGERRTLPTIDCPADVAEGDDLKDAGVIDNEAVYYINKVKTGVATDDATASTKQFFAVPFASPLEHYVNYFNTMEDENVAQAIPNSESMQWMQDNIPLFECPDKQIEEMYYFRWWTFRKAIQKTEQGYGINEFLIKRSYSDKYNLIACALGHHVMEGRWLRNQQYIEDDVRIWLRGNEGKPLNKITKFSSWLPYAMWLTSQQRGNTTWMNDFKTDLENDIAQWETNNSYGDGLFWQRDVKDGMEEQISGARKLNHRRPTINSYMYGNYMAMSWLEGLNHDQKKSEEWKSKADKLKSLIEEKLWNHDLKFYGTLTTVDTLVKVREEIGYLPWYVNMPADDSTKYAPAWKQLMDENGFNAPYGITTAERRHPLFRKSYKPGRPTCEWDGAIWPFSTSQTLTALANVINNYPNLTQAAVIDGKALPLSSPAINNEKVNGARDWFFYHLKKYTESQYRRGRPYVGEYLDEIDGQWLMGDRERSRYYNHSTYCDVIITGLVGLRPDMGDKIIVNPIIPEDWDYFCLAGIPYHGKLITIIYDKDGTRYHQGKGLQIIEN